MLNKMSIRSFLPKKLTRISYTREYYQVHLQMLPLMTEITRKVHKKRNTLPDMMLLIINVSNLVKISSVSSDSSLLETQFGSIPVFWTVGLLTDFCVGETLVVYKPCNWKTVPNQNPQHYIPTLNLLPNVKNYATVDYKLAQNLTGLSLNPNLLPTTDRKTRHNSCHSSFINSHTQFPIIKKTL